MQQIFLPGGRGWLLKLCGLVAVGLRYINRVVSLQTMRCSSPAVPGAQRWEVEKVIVLKSPVIDFGILNGKYE